MADLGRKQRISNDAWLEAISGIEEKVSVQEIQDISARALEAIREATVGKKAAYAWSAGKDSIVLGSLCEAAGVHDSMIGVCNLEYPAFMQWVEQNKPAGCEIINTKQVWPLPGTPEKYLDERMERQPVPLYADVLQPGRQVWLAHLAAGHR